MNADTRTPGAVARLSDWIESLSPTIRPAAYGALFIVLLMFTRGVWFVIPIAVIYVSVTSTSPATTVGLGQRPQCRNDL